MKHWMILIGVAAMGAGGTSTASARIGETLDQCQVRYGVMVRVESGVRQDYPQYCFQKGDVEIRVRLYNGASAQETFLALHGKLTAAQIDEITQSNSESVTGKPVTMVRKIPPGLRSKALIITTAEFHKVFYKDAGTGF
jgi:hypothetical protein